MRKTILASLIMTFMFILGACSDGEFKADHKYKVEPFEFTNQKNETISLEDLKGDVWLSQFIFTECTSVCPPMMFNMAELQDKLIEEGVKDYKIVSFSVDPDVDTPEKLQEYLDMFDVADESKWELLTGFSQDRIIDLALKSFKAWVVNDPNSNQVIHGTQFFLVNQNGEVVKIYDGNLDVPFDQIIKDMKALIKQGSK